MFSENRSVKGSKGAKKGARKFVQKARGLLHPRVQQVGPEHFGLVCVDCAKARAKWMVCDFYGNLLLPPTVLNYGQGEFQTALCQLAELRESRPLSDLIVAVERTGNYHLPILRAFGGAGYETRVVHPFATKQFRQIADPGNKTDDNDLNAIFRAATSGFGLQELPLGELHEELRIVARLRRDLVLKRSAVCCQMREQGEALLPGFAALFEDLWKTPAALAIARHFLSPAEIHAAGPAGLARHLATVHVECRRNTLEKVLAWSGMATNPAPLPTVHQRVWLALDDDRLQKTRQIETLEQQLCALLVRTPYLLLLSFPGINVVSASEFAGEMGPISHYANAKAITGRCGLYPARYQSDQVDLANGQLVRCANRSLRAIILLIADNLLKCNAYFRARGQIWRAQHKDPRDVHVRVATRFCRIAFQIVAGRQVFQHPGCRSRDYVLEKLWKFLQPSSTPLSQTMTILQTATAQIPDREFAAEAKPLQQTLEKLMNSRRGPQPLANLLTLVLARLGVGELQSTSEASNPS